MLFGKEADLGLNTNRLEHDTFLENAFAWFGSATPRVMPTVFVSILYCSMVRYFIWEHTEYDLDIGPFEYSGVVLSLMLVFRMNAGHDRWWEARKLWGSIVNQSRNLATIGNAYTPQASASWRREFTSLVQTLPHVMRLSLREDRDLKLVEPLLSSELYQEIESSQHRPNAVSLMIAQRLQEAREKEWIDPFAFQRAERERAILIDDIGACE
ncbi:MAG: hypothetical protein EOP09_13470, partial [Proteobacteria bacterium]